jgi:hypothetical protein
MFDKIGRVAETMATRASLSRRGFLGQSARVAGGVALGMMAFLMPNAASAIGAAHCKCELFGYGCDPGDIYCTERCNIRCLYKKRGR